MHEKVVGKMGSTAMLATKRSAGDAELILKIYLMQITEHASEGIHAKLKTQGRRHQKSKTGISVAKQKGLMASKYFFKKGSQN